MHSQTAEDTYTHAHAQLRREGEGGGGGGEKENELSHALLNIVTAFM